MPSAAALARLADTLAPWQRAFPQARWTASDDIHLTLIFVAALPAAQVPAAVSAVAAVAADIEPFEIALRGAGEFGGRGRASVTWLGVGDGVPAVSALETVLRSRLAALPGLEDLADDALSLPHLTVARRAPAGLAVALREAFATSGPAWTVERITLFRSDLSDRGARHQQIVSAPLGSSLPAAAAGHTGLARGLRPDVRT